MEINDIHLFIRNANDYKLGVAIYNHFGTSAVLKKCFANSENNFWKEKLITEMKKLAIEHPEIIITPSQKTKIPTAIKSHNNYAAFSKKPFIDISKLPTELKDKFKENGNIRINAEYLKRLLQDSLPQKRYTIVAEIAELHQRNIANWADINYYNEFKAEKPKKESVDLRTVQRIPPAKKHNLLQSYMAQRSKLRKTNLVANQDKIADLTLKIKLLRAELQ
jgi:hypothetical protein